MPLNLQNDAEHLSQQLIHWRRYLHQHPELSGQEKSTADYIADALSKIGYSPKKTEGNFFGVMADLDIGADDFVALRADTDALPIQEDTGLSFQSQTPGVMHACGHDAHVAMLLGAAQLLWNHKDKLRHNVRLIFQPHEELDPGGAPRMIEAGALDGVKRIFALHVWSRLACGKIGLRSGPVAASPTELEITIHGKGGHAALPHECCDPIVIASEIVLALQTVVSRSIDISEQAVVSVTQFNAGTTHNVIPEQTRLCGTIRTFDYDVRTRVCDRVSAIAKGIAQSHGGKAEVNLVHGYPPLIADASEVARAKRAAATVGFAAPDIGDVSLNAGGEDFAYYCERVPGAFAILGGQLADDEAAFPHHHPKMDINEDALAKGAAVLASWCFEE